MEFNIRETITLGIIVLFLGKAINRRIPVLRDYNIPEPVTGGVLASVLFSSFYWATDVALEFDLTGRDFMLVIFFTTIGFGARLDRLVSGGPALLVLFALAACYLVLQNFTGVAVATLTGLDPRVGLLGGSISMSGGHGTSIAWSPVFIERFGIDSAAEIGIACSTFGLILGGLAGGPLARRLIARHRLQSTDEQHLVVGKRYDQSESIDVDTLLQCVFWIFVAVGLGGYLQKVTGHLGLFMPDFVYCLFAGIVITNALPRLLPRAPHGELRPTMALVSNFCLGLFLAQSLMSLQLWTLNTLAGPLLMIVLAQLLAIMLYAYFVVFRVMGANYDAAVISSGYVGMALGATPTAMANMTAVTQKAGASTRAFIIVPLIGALFIDLSNAVVIEFFLNLLG
ncbi:MAG: sodium/glutamate symporter [Halioglobus sp.]|nr:sodium/glutamate symporter [Halioglobus sp.]|tara:strand:- start:582 stop:1775 length:1194 start_codon:yes stop_codon:yes gene_type:complete